MLVSSLSIWTRSLPVHFLVQLLSGYLAFRAALKISNSSFVSCTFLKILFISYDIIFSNFYGDHIVRNFTRFLFWLKFPFLSLEIILILVSIELLYSIPGVLPLIPYVLFDVFCIVPAFRKTVCLFLFSLLPKLLVMSIWVTPAVSAVALVLLVLRVQNDVRIHSFLYCRCHYKVVQPCFQQSRRSWWSSCPVHPYTQVSSILLVVYLAIWVNKSSVVMPKWISTHNHFLRTCKISLYTKMFLAYWIQNFVMHLLITLTFAGITSF